MTSHIKTVALTLLVLSGCAEMKMPTNLLSVGAGDPNATLFDQHFKGSAAGQTKVVPRTENSYWLQFKAQGVAEDAQIDNYLNSILARLQKSLPDTPPAARVYVTPDTAFSGASYEDGGIFIPYKMFSALQSEDELATLIAHEYSHVILQHHKTNWIDSAANITYSVGNMYINRQTKSATPENLLGMTAANEAALGISQIGVMPALTRDQENQADMLGADLLIKAHYSYVGAMDLMSRMQDWDMRNDEVLKSRKANYINLFSKDEKNLVAQAVEGQVDILENEIGGLIQETSRHHEKGDGRTTMLRGYLKQHYSGIERPALQESAYRAVMNSSHTKSFFSGIDMAQASSLALQSKNAAAALTSARKATQTPAASMPFTKHVMINALSVNGKGADSLALLEKTVNEGYSLFADNRLLLAALKPASPEKALILAESTYEKFAHSPELYPDLIALNKRMKNPIVAMKYLGLCAGSAISASNNALMDSCNKAKND